MMENATNNEIMDRVASETSTGIRPVSATVALLAEGATVPFIARYRKERTGGLDEVKIIAIRDAYERIQELEKRRTAILGSLSEQNVLTPELEKTVRAAGSLAVLEDIYLPYRPHRRTRAMIAREKGLEPLADIIFAGEVDPHLAATDFVNTEQGVHTVDEAIAGALDVIAERISEDAAVRGKLRDLFQDAAFLSAKRAASRSTGQKLDEAQVAKYRDYFEWSEAARTAPSHRILAILRGQNEKILSCHALPPEDRALTIISQLYLRSSNAGKPSNGARIPAASDLLSLACEDSYRRLLAPALENELLAGLKQRADEEAVRVFAANLRELLMASPLGNQPVLAVDPGFRTGCKLACLDSHGNLLHSEPVYALEPHNRREEAAKIIRGLVAKHNPEAVAIGNGTGGREMFAFCRELALVRESDGRPLIVTMVSESGASVYSASDVAREEFPDQDVTVRGAVSIGRRLMDPLSELVKIDPKSIGVGQYQHDVDQKMLRSSLDDVVASCVNAVGVDLNTASIQLLKSVSGLNERLAKNIIRFRSEHGGFRNRAELAKVGGLGPRTFEQCAGFLRIRDGENALDASAVHPESYDVVQAMARDLGCAPGDLISRPDMHEKIRLEHYITDSIGLPTLKDILRELDKPGRDPRSDFKAVAFADDIREISDLKPGLKLPGVVTNVTAFGAFVDIGVHQDGLVHISQLADRFVRDPAEVARVGQTVDVTVLTVDVSRKRVGLSMKSHPEIPAP